MRAGVSSPLEHCNDSLRFAGSQSSAVSAGLIEGALARADEVVQQVVASTKIPRNSGNSEFE